MLNSKILTPLSPLLVLCCSFSGSWGQWLWPGGGLVGVGCSHVWDDVRPAALLQPGSWKTLWIDPHGWDPFSSYTWTWGKIFAVRTASERPKAAVRKLENVLKSLLVLYGLLHVDCFKNSWWISFSRVIDL